jgi:ubiquinone/menaquinone biosynthesis C-methylase UbiE
MNPPVVVRPLPLDKVENARSAFRALSAKFVRDHPESPYKDYVGAAASNDAVLDRQVKAFQLYAPYVTDGMQILDWGCRHAPDSCMLKTVYPHVTISGCDTMNDDFSTFHDYAGLNFTTLNHTYELPYDDAHFDAVISGGVLEHVAFEYESLKEVWRVLKDGGLFFITFLPNSRSWSENLSRLIGSMNGHNRTYSLSETRAMLLRRGFSLETSGYHQIFPTLGKSASDNMFRKMYAGLTVPLNRPLEHVPVLRSVASNLYLVVRKVNCL